MSALKILDKYPQIQLTRGVQDLAGKALIDSKKRPVSIEVSSEGGSKAVAFFCKTNN